MKKGQNTRHEKEYFNSGIGGKISSSKLNNLVRSWGLNQNVHQKAKNLARKKNKRK